MGSMILLAVTNHITQNISSVPFLWVLPLALYLVSFVLAFDHPRWTCGRSSSRRSSSCCRPWRTSCLRSTSPWRRPCTRRPVRRLHVLHGDLARAKPDPAHLTRFYLMISLAARWRGAGRDRRAPHAAGLFRARDRADRSVSAPRATARGTARRGGVAVATVTAGSLRKARTTTCRRARHGARLLRRGAHRRPSRSGAVPLDAARRHQARRQLLGDSFRNTPADYFGPTSGYGRVFTSLREMAPGKPLSVGVLVWAPASSARG